MSAALDPNASYGSAEVAQLLFRVSLRTFYNRHKTLKTQDFPPPICPTGRPCWSGAALIAWRDRPRPVKSPRAQGGLKGSSIVLFSTLSARAKRLATRA